MAYNKFLEVDTQGATGRPTTFEFSDFRGRPIMFLKQ